MRAPRAVTLAVLAVVLAGLVIPAAHGETVRVHDPTGDGQHGPLLDVTSVQVANRDHAIVVTVAVVRATYGDLTVRLTARGDRRRDFVQVINEHLRHKDRTGLYGVEGKQPCRRLSVQWHDGIGTVTVRLPSSCFRDGNYGAVRLRVLTLVHSDTADWAPQDSAAQLAWTPWVGRG